VVLIIGILAAVALPQYQTAVGKSRAAEALINLKALAGAVDRYVLETGGSYPNDFSKLDIAFGDNCSGANCIHGAYCYTLQYTESQKLVSAYADMTCGGNVLTLAIFFEDTDYYSIAMKRGDILCIARWQDQLKRICLALGGKTSFTGSAPAFILGR